MNEFIIKISVFQKKKIIKLLFLINYVCLYSVLIHYNPYYKTEQLHNGEIL